MLHSFGIAAPCIGVLIARRRITVAAATTAAAAATTTTTANVLWIECVLKFY